MNREIRLVDRGRGLQLSTSRITVQDLVPYFQRGCSDEEIQRLMPTLSLEEIRVVENFYRANQTVLDDEDLRIRKAQAERRQEFYARFPPPSDDEREARVRRFMEERRVEKSRAGDSR
jgi:uncharacterized protein (DUF433 family)